MKRFISKGNWTLGGLTITSKGKTFGQGVVPLPFKTWEEAEKAVMNHRDFNSLVFLLPEDAPGEEEKKPAAARPFGEYGCRWCGAEHSSAEELNLHLSQCPVLLEEKERLRLEALADLGLLGLEDPVPEAPATQTIPPLNAAAENDPAELEAVAAEAEARQAVIEEEKAAREKRRAEQAAYQKKVEKKSAKKTAKSVKG